MLNSKVLHFPEYNQLYLGSAFKESAHINRLWCETKSTIASILPVALVPGYTGLVRSALMDGKHLKNTWLLCKSTSDRVQHHNSMISDYLIKTRVTHIVQMRELNYNWGRERSGGGLDGHRQNLGVEDCAVSRGKQKTISG